MRPSTATLIDVYESIAAFNAVIGGDLKADIEELKKTLDALNAQELLIKSNDDYNTAVQALADQKQQMIDSIVARSKELDTQEASFQATVDSINQQKADLADQQAALATAREALKKSTLDATNAQKDRENALAPKELALAQRSQDLDARQASLDIQAADIKRRLEVLKSI